MQHQKDGTLGFHGLLGMLRRGKKCPKCHGPVMRRRADEDFGVGWHKRADARNHKGSSAGWLYDCATCESTFGPREFSPLWRRERPRDDA